MDVGVDVHAGATWMFTHRFGMFAEYRFTHYDAHVNNNSDFTGYDVTFTAPVDFKATIDTHHFLTGFACHFD